MIKQIASWLTTETVEDKAKTKMIVDQIHKEFNTAGEQLALEAKTLISSLSEKELAKVERLEKLGFTESITVKANKEKVHLKNLAHKHVRVIERYAIEYPNYKFITEEQVNAICKKYNLACGDVSIYKGFVPEKNLIEIEKFQGVLLSDWENSSYLVIKVEYEDWYGDWRPIVKDFIKKRNNC